MIIILFLFLAHVCFSSYVFSLFSTQLHKTGDSEFITLCSGIDVAVTSLIAISTTSSESQPKTSSEIGHHGLVVTGDENGNMGFWHPKSGHCLRMIHIWF